MGDQLEAGFGGEVLVMEGGWTSCSLEMLLNGIFGYVCVCGGYMGWVGVCMSVCVWCGVYMSGYECMCVYCMECI